MSEPIIFKDPEREGVLWRYRDDQTMTQILKHAYRVQDVVNADILSWKQPSSGNVDEVMAWLVDRNPLAGQSHPMGFNCQPTPYDYRRHARALAVRLLFRIADPYWTDLDFISSFILGDRWSKDERIDYWRSIAICSSVWEETR
ncbi:MULTISPECIES: hypothetical protein [unclassified Ensifer]|uniref:hypothetical protein n=1 Tax=unclassified Ensifer TaxID=2633371 RepID=UPI000812E660|nr:MULTISPECIES: hypothetical protein [unclassified Ensifer]OCP21955.1 hypothetical protein BC361_25640 [Ensifer sp. LC54]OCP23265.1 hypothetical protein BC363_25125 [Ensifer sp. LC384]